MICKKCLFCNDLFSKNVKKININEGVISSSRRGITAYPRRLQDLFKKKKCIELLRMWIIKTIYFITLRSNLGHLENFQASRL